MPKESSTPKTSGLRLPAVRKPKSEQPDAAQAAQTLAMMEVTVPSIENLTPTPMDLPTIFEREEKNQDCAHLYVNKNFFNAYNLSAYFTRTVLWPGIVAREQYVTAHPMGVRVGFPVASLAKAILGAAKNKIGFEAINNKSGQLMELRFGPFKPAGDAYTHWRDNFLRETERGKQLLKPSYSDLPVYLELFRYFNLVLVVTNKFKHPYDHIFQSRLIDAAVAINESFFLYSQDKNNYTQTLKIIGDIKKNLNKMTFYFRLAFEAQAYSMEANGNLMKQKAVIERQLTLWEKSIASKCSTTITSGGKNGSST
ncbi:hypothetical protein IJJ08_00010 [bacterium]|nr:hypothetical protein [bacterium]